MFQPGDKCLYFYLLIMIFLFFDGLFLLGTQFLGYSKSSVLSKLEEINPDIPIIALQGFEFKNISNISYKPGISNLGSTGQLELDCFYGICSRYIKRVCEEEYCYVPDSDEYPSYNVFDFKKNLSITQKKSKKMRKLNSCYTSYYDCSITQKDIIYDCGEQCRKNYKPSYYYSDTCYCPSNYDDSSTSCRRQTISEYNSSKSCNPYNLILYWKKYYYQKNEKEYSYVKNAVLPNENCPSGTRQCGILDKFGNKLCLPQKEKCPINFIKIGTEPPDGSHYFTGIDIGNETIYYSNEFNTSLIIKELYADSNISLENKTNYEIIDTYNISSFIYENYKIYTHNSKDPYKDKNIDSKGKSYLKFAYHDPDYFINLTEMKLLYNQYEFNKTINSDVMNKVKSNLTTIFFCSFFGDIYLSVILFFLIFGGIYGAINEKQIFCVKFFNPYNEDYFGAELIEFLKFLLILFPFIVLSLVSIIFSKISSDRLNETIEGLEQKSEIIDNINKLNNLFYNGSIIKFCLLSFLLILTVYIELIKKCLNSRNVNYSKSKSNKLIPS